MAMAVFYERVGRAQEVPEVALEAADGFSVGLPLGGLAGEVVARFGVAAGAGDGDAVDGGGELPSVLGLRP
jgi:hypothetical protein